MSTSSPPLCAIGAALALSLAAVGQADAAGPQPPRRCPLQPGHPGWLEQQMQRREAELGRHRDRAIELIEVFLERHPDAPQRADALFRLAELQWEQAEAQLLERMRRYEAELDAFRSGQSGTRPPEPRIDLSASLDVYEEILRQHPDFERSDTVLYLYGFALNEQGDEAAALGIFRSLLSRFPQSSFVPDAHLAIGEHYFAKGRFAAALKAYAKVLEHVDSPLYDLALYKTAWCHFKRDRAAQAAEYFKRVLARARQRKRQQPDERLPTPSADLEREALEDLAFTFSEYGGAAEAYRFMAQVGGEEYSIRVLERLGQVFFRQARYDQAIDSYRLLVERFPLAEDSPEHQLRIALAYERQGEMERSLAERRRLAERYGPGSSFAQHHTENPPVRDRALELAEQALRFAALMRHKQAQQRRDEKAYSNARAAYGAYLDRFADTDEAPRIRYYLGEVLFELGDYAGAAGHYRQAAETLAEPKERRDAAYAAVLSWDRLRRQDERPDEPPAEAQPLDRAERGFVAAVEAYAAIAADDPKLAQLRFELGRTYYDRGHFDQAAETLLALVRRRPADEFAAPAADLALDCFSRSRQWAALERWALRFIDEGWFASSELGEQLPGFAAGATFQQAAALVERERFVKAAREYERLVADYPDSELAPKALFNAAVNLERAGDKRAAIERYQQVIERYPARAADALYVIAGIYEKQYAYAAAAEAYERFSERFSDDRRAAESLLQASLLHRARKAPEREAAALAAFVRRFGDHPKAPSARFRQAEALVRAGDHGAAERVLRDYLRRHARRQGRVRDATLQLGLALVAQGQRRQAERQFERCAAFRPRRAPEGDELAAAAHCRFQLGELEFDAYQRIALRPPMKRLTRLLSQKAARLKRAEALFTRVIQAGHPEWASAALFRIGDMYAAFAKAIYEAPMPQGLSPRELEVYRQELQSLAFPIEDKALKAFTVSHRVALKHAYYSVWTRRTVERLRQLDPARFPPEPEVRPATRWADSFTDFGLALEWRKPPPLPPPAGAAEEAE